MASRTPIDHREALFAGYDFVCGHYPKSALFAVDSDTPCVFNWLDDLLTIWREEWILSFGGIIVLQVIGMVVLWAFLWTALETLDLDVVALILLPLLLLLGFFL